MKTNSDMLPGTSFLQSFEVLDEGMQLRLWQHPTVVYWSVSIFPITKTLLWNIEVQHNISPKNLLY